MSWKVDVQLCFMCPFRYSWWTETNSDYCLAEIGKLENLVKLLQSESLTISLSFKGQFTKNSIEIGIDVYLISGWLVYLNLAY